MTNKAVESGSHEKKCGGENFSNRSLPEREGGFRAGADVSVQTKDAKAGRKGSQFFGFEVEAPRFSVVNNGQNILWL